MAWLKPCPSESKRRIRLGRSLSSVMALQSDATTESERNRRETWRVLRRGLVDGAAVAQLLGLELEFAEGALVLRQVLAQDVEQSLCLLRAEEDSLLGEEGDLVGRVGLHGAED